MNSGPIEVETTEVNPSDRFDHRVDLNESLLFGRLPEGWVVESHEIPDRDTTDARRKYWHLCTHTSLSDIQIRFTPQGSWVFDNTPSDADTRWAVRLEGLINDEPLPTEEPEQGFYDFESAVTHLRTLMNRVNDGRASTQPVLG